MRSISQLLLLAAIAAAISGATLVLVRSSFSGSRIEVTLPTATVEADAELMVYVTGAVRNPGVYRMSNGDRLAEVIEVAGGATGDADLAAINLAVRVKDEDHWHIPRTGEAPQQPVASGSARQQRIDVNVASVASLMELPGIGETKAESIVRYREANGPFAEVEDLLAIQGIGATTLEAIRDLVEVR